MFTRAGVVVEWKTEDGRCAALDPRFPLIRELASLLRAIEKHHKLRMTGDIRAEVAALIPTVERRSSLTSWWPDRYCSVAHDRGQQVVV